ncbi:hypothetical protein AVEN_32731-1 [Araneus ventricosus]|uniref:Uncharacterized protein n=1 Tax=Araneus ventricosus TaxID=182803 RepID=A0A4Y2T4J4_ARAVE|nr:hypothetical protein AVEN_32731-1 [Araneus ventricosus]
MERSLLTARLHRDQPPLSLRNTGPFLRPVLRPSFPPRCSRVFLCGPLSWERGKGTSHNIVSFNNNQMMRATPQLASPLQFPPPQQRA